ncbi:DNA alkylation repair protein [bacterium]|nr:MAG: DNA alkylation repair protein [bacterium]
MNKCKEKILKEIRNELNRNVDSEYKVGIQRFFKEEVKVYGVRGPVFKKISRKYFKQVNHLDKKEIFELCECLLNSGYGEEIGMAFDWAFRLKKYFDESDFKIFENWLSKYVSNWGACDSFCSKAFGEYILQFPQFLPQVKSWTKSKNRWMRRASAVIMIYSNRKGKYIKDSFHIADMLLLDEDDMVQKGYGWMLKEISKAHPQMVFDYVMKNKSRMPRTALRYAIEKLSPELRKKAMEK